MKQAQVYMFDRLAGMLIEDEEGFHFQYQQEYLFDKSAVPVSLTLPLQGDTYHSKTLFPFFDGLIPEGWLLDILIKTRDISVLDRMSLLLTCCEDCIGAVSVIPVQPLNR